MSTLLAAPYNLVLGDLVVVKVAAYNANGWGSESSPNTFGATVRTIPAAMNNP
jgi:hypothetical protein